MPKWKPLKGQRVRDLVVLEDYKREDVDIKYKHWCKCISDTGDIIHINAAELSRRLKRGNPLRGYIKHEMTNSRFYGIYNHIYQRCNNPNNDRYARYGGRGIKCLWKNFQEFYNDMYESYQKHFKEHNGDTTIDRIDNNGNYCKENCRWLTNKEQQANKECTQGIEENGKILSIKEYCRQHLINYDHLRYIARKSNSTLKDVLLLEVNIDEETK